MENNEDADKLATEGAKKGVAAVGEVHMCEHNSGKTHIFAKHGNQNSSRRWNNVHPAIEEAWAEDEGDNRKAHQESDIQAHSSANKPTRDS